MTAAESQMLREIREIPEAVARLLDRSGPAIAAAAAGGRALDPAFVATVARGSSDHAATYLKYVCEIVLGLPVASIGPSVEPQEMIPTLACSSPKRRVKPFSREM